MNKITKIFQAGEVLKAQDLNIMKDKINELVEGVDNSETTTGKIEIVSTEGFHFADSSGNGVMNYTADGFDAAKISRHFVELLKEAGISGTMEYEIFSNKVYNI